LKDGIDCLILPGGETTAMRIASKSERLYPALFEWMKDNPHSPVLGTCAGAILMCQLGEETECIVDAVISRNSYGRQKESFQADVQISGLTFEVEKELSNEMTLPITPLDNSFQNIIGETSLNHRPLIVSSSLIESHDEHIFPAIFIRAPRFGQIGENVSVIATNGDEVVGVLEGNKMALTFHPELTSDYRFHRWLLQKSNDGDAPTHRLSKMDQVLPMASSVFPPERGEAEGCVQCQKGSKLVLFVTGECHWKCDYCPLSENRREIDIMYANERPCTQMSEVVEEARAMRATGTGITGGDPMMALERTLDACRILKSEFGPDHHIHMYTSLPFDPRHASRLAEAGLDEIRFHLLDLKMEKYIGTMQACTEAGLFVGVEIPAEPDKEVELFALIEELRSAPIQFLNLNELEITTGNQENMEIRGYNLSMEITAGAAGSAELAIALKKRVNNALRGLPDNIDNAIHLPFGFHLKFCTAKFKDAGQLRSRFRRRAEMSMRPYEVLTEDDTLWFGALYCPPEHAQDDIAEIAEYYEIDKSWLHWDAKNLRIELPLFLAEEIAETVSVAIAAVEVHPTHERLEVGLTWLNTHRPK
jgi:pyruvate formate-lyase activating enzyme-like uncharacterized protein/glutamine amidotransferase PdxT